ncbi:hypothetical protein [Chondromyces crocatus]|uniref:Uncharacterized protein n=1 Tax=Chondromyces crocatus TaxID=52 RepID=A0A0K1EJ57_CHOCO|nr:hypothetical protein [Chondromyces crocatus]AKT40608.1 uncharacterized protein CMC5_047640 [Chondromyces crocatus]
MTHANYLYRILHRPASRARAMINGIPIYEREPEANVSPIGPITHWLSRGENAITVELTSAPPSPRTPLLGPHFELQVARDGATDQPLFRWEYPDGVAAVGLTPELPWVHQGILLVDEDLPEPAYRRGTPEDFPVEGTREQHEAVYALYDAFGARDAARFEAVMGLKVQEFERFYGPQPLSRVEALQRMNAPWVMEPFDAQDLRFDRYVDGRVVHVRRASGKPAVKAVHRDEPYLGWGSNFYMTRLDGRWQIFW